ncbi:MAG: hypothetical protein CVV53_02195 [Spirochaetae bacterium HGW-Spirochaetae-9]|nr:MAG: hypothetical protein CVV53_02195 [Spirochaetae bacterium HGW-Spirochaetae-9]
MLVLLLTSLNLQAQEVPKDATSAPWVLGFSRFIQVSPELLANLETRGLNLEQAGECAAQSAEGILDRTIPALLASALEPMPKRVAKDNDGKPVLVKTLLNQSGNDLRYREIQAGMEALKGLDGLVAGFYSLIGENIECSILLFSKGGEGAASNAGSMQPDVLAFSGSISDLDSLAARLLPGLLSWAAGRELGILDVRTEPEHGVLLTVGRNPSPMNIYVAGSRLFIHEAGEYEIIMNRKGFEEGRRTLALRPGYYSSLDVKLTSIGSEPTLGSGESIFSADETLRWEEKSRFIEAERKFSAALGRFIISVPLSALALGSYFSYSEAFSRSAVSIDALSWSGAGAIISVSLSAAFIVDSALKLMDVLRASR